MSLPWFRMYAEFATDPVVQSLSFDDQRHFVMLLCLKCSGLLDRKFATEQDRSEVIRKSIGLDGMAWDEMGERLYRMKLVDEFCQPLNWNKRQFISDSDPTNAERQRKHRDKERNGRVTDVSRPSDTDSDSDTEKNSEGQKAVHRNFDDLRKALPTPNDSRHTPAQRARIAATKT